MSLIVFERRNFFPGEKAKQLNYHTNPTLSEHQYDAAIIHVGINDLLNAKSGTRGDSVIA